jgi:hypothetical protein
MMKRTLFVMYFNFIDENEYFHQINPMSLIKIIFNQNHGIYLMKMLIFINEIKIHHK